VASDQKHGNEHSVSVKEGEFLEKMRDCQLLNKGCAPCSGFLRHMHTSVLRQKSYKIHHTEYNLYKRHTYVNIVIFITCNTTIHDRHRTELLSHV
jgi:hypothetical protein